MEATAAARYGDLQACSDETSPTRRELEWAKKYRASGIFRGMLPHALLVGDKSMSQHKVEILGPIVPLPSHRQE
jgi:hypothetical protein